MSSNGSVSAVPINSIIVGSDRRPLRDIPELAESIQRLDLLNPITLTEDLRLIAGARRLAACQSLGWTSIPANVMPLEGMQVELAEIDENLIRNELTVVERGEQYARRKEIYEALYPQTKQGGDRKSAEVQAAKSSACNRRLKSFADDTASKTGVDPKRIREEVQIARSIAEPVRAKIRETPLANRKEDLLKLARLKPAKQEAVVEVIAANPTLNVVQAQREVENAEKLAILETKAAFVKEQGPPTWNIICGNCVNELETIDRGSVRLIFADPPYNQYLDYGEGHDDKLERDEYLSWCWTWMEACVRTLADDGSMWVLISDAWADEFGCLLRHTGLYRRRWLIWYEKAGVNNVNNFNGTSRHLFYMVKDPKNFVFHESAVLCESERPKTGRERGDPTAKVWDSVWGVNPPIHRLVGNAAERVPGFPTQLPLDLLRPIVGCASDPGDLVLDPFSGSGTCGAACIELGRRYIGIEQSEEFVRLSTVRLKITSPDIPTMSVQEQVACMDGRAT